ncbi:MAG TPA: glycosyl hydrolase, partial [Thermoanaerobaculia bacterium]|nr:glycosyl hydrolase [Thermoanaerobaculia bacterium]
APALPIGQFYHVSVDSRVPFRVAGAMQDIGTAQAPSNTLSGGGIRNTDWYSVGGGEAGWVVSDPAEPDIVYAGEYLGYLSRYDHRTRQERNVSAWPDNPSGWAGAQMRYRFQWTAPIAVSPHPPHAVYHGANVLFRSTDRGETWSAISPDLTRDDESKQRWSGGPITGDNTGVETYCTIFVVAESPVEKGIIWAGSDDGLVHVTRDHGKSWQNVTAAVPGLPEWGTVSMIEPSRFDAGTAYLVVDAHRLDDMRPYLWKTTDFGRSWKRLDGDLPRATYLHAVREDRVQRGVLYLGTERGVAFSADDGRTWRSLKLNLPTVAVHDLALTPDALVVGTNGRSIWILDDLATVRALALDPGQRERGERQKQKTRLLPPPEAVRWAWTSEPDDRFAGDNPPAGALLYYWLEDEPKGEVTLEIRDAGGTVVRRLSSQAAEPVPISEYVEEERDLLKLAALPKGKGLQRTVWDFSWDGAEMIPGGILDSGYPGAGPAAAPGTYTVRLTVDGVTSAGSDVPLTLRPDPRSPASPADLLAQQTFALEVRDALTRLSRSVVRLRAVRRQLGDRNALLAKDGKAGELVKAAEALIARLDALEARLHNPKAEIAYDILAQEGGAALYSRLSPFFGWVKAGDGAPTQGQREVFAELSRELAGATAELGGLLERDLAELNQTAGGLGLPTVYVPAAGGS